MIKPYRSPDEERDPYEGVSDSIAIRADAPPTVERSREPVVKPYEPKTPQRDSDPTEPAPRTFGDMEREGDARPPMPRPTKGTAMDADPAPMTTMSVLPAAALAYSGAPLDSTTAPRYYNPDSTSPDHDASLPWAPEPPPVTPAPESPTPDAPPADASPPAAADRGNNPKDWYWLPTDTSESGPTGGKPAGWQPPAAAPVANDREKYYDPDPSSPTFNPDRSLPWRPAKPTTAEPPADKEPPKATNPILDLLTGGATGTDESDLEKEIADKAKKQLEDSSPYDSDAVRAEYEWLGGDIDDRFATEDRLLADRMAARGLYGSAGKDFHTGRSADLNVGKRTAKASLAQDLATKYATTKGQYDANAIDQASGVAGQADAKKRAWLQALMGYGNDAFTNDLASAEFQQRQNESEQDFLLRMIQMGYGV